MKPAFRRWGEAGPQAVLLHCSLASSAAWAGVAARLQERCQLLAPDLIGHGRAADWDPAQSYASQALAAIDALMPSAPVHLVGHSFGGVLALAYALGHQDRVRSLTLIEPVLFCASDGPGRVAADAVLADMGRHLERGDFPAAAKDFLSLWGGGVPFADLPTAQQSYTAHRMPLIAAQQAVLFDDSEDILPRLPGFAVPVTLIEGAMSPPVIAEILDRLEADLPASRRQVIDGAGHMAPISHPEAVAKAIAAGLV